MAYPATPIRTLRTGDGGGGGIALFPRPVGGRQLALCRSDGETIGLSTLDAQHQWQSPVLLHAPQQSWELIQVGNCVSPVETDAGWLVLTHGVGPMRRYAIGALLLDLDRPDRVIAALPQALLAPEDAEHDGYVPNVVYSCGSLLHGGTLWLPYASATPASASPPSRSTRCSPRCSQSPRTRGAHHPQAHDPLPAGALPTVP